MTGGTEASILGQKRNWPTDTSPSFFTTQFLPGSVPDLFPVPCLTVLMKQNSRLLLWLEQWSQTWLTTMIPAFQGIFIPTWSQEFLILSFTHSLLITESTKNKALATSSYTEIGRILFALKETEHGALNSPVRSQERFHREWSLKVEYKFKR